MKVAAVVVSHGTPGARSPHSLPALQAAGRRARRDREHPGLRSGRRRGRPRTTEPLGYGANLNRGLRADDGADSSSRSTPTPCPSPARSRRSRRSWRSIRRCGVAGPRMELPDGTWQPSRRRFPTVAGTIVRRTPLRLRRPAAAALPSRLGRADGAGRGGLDARRLPDAAAHDARRARRLRRGLPPLRRGHRPAVPRHARRAGSGGTCRPRSSATSTRPRPTSAG